MDGHSRQFGFRSRVLAWVAVTGSLAACAVQVPPSGGPEDKTPPKVAATVPARDSTGVSPASDIAITFSEDMTRARLERNVSVQPPITIGTVKWHGQTLVIHPEGGLKRDTTYVVRLKAGYRDRHGASSAQSYQFAFATGAELDTARIQGTVYFKRKPTAKAIVRCFRLPGGKDFSPEAARPDRETMTAADGSYSLRNLPSNDARFLVMAFVDNNANESLDREGEPYTVVPDTIRLTRDVPVVPDLKIWIIDPNEPAVVQGVVTNQTGIDSLEARVVLLAAADTSRVFLLTSCDAKGKFQFATVKPGDYVLRAFLDIRPDSTCGRYPCARDSVHGCPEPCTRLPGTLAVKPGATVDVPPLVLRRTEGP